METERQTFIYILIDPRDGQVRYVGKTNNTKRRYNHHLIDNVKSYKSSWVKQLRKIELRPTLEVIDEVPIDEWVFWEKYWIAQFRAWGFNLTNLSDGGEGFPSGSLNPAHLPHVKILKSEIHKGKIIPQEMRDRISRSLSGRKNPEHSNKMKGRTQTREHNEKKSHSMRGKNTTLTETKVVEIKKMLRDNPNKLTMQEIANLFSIKRCTIKNIKLNKTWGHIII
jgi:hypothetical protein